MAARIYDISKRLGLEPRDVLTVAKQLGIVAAEAPSSSLDETDSVLLEEACLKRHGSYQERQLRHAAAAKGYQDAAEQGAYKRGR